MKTNNLCFMGENASEECFWRNNLETCNEYVICVKFPFSVGNLMVASNVHAGIMYPTHCM